jgi:hypothetical protein
MEAHLLSDEKDTVSGHHIEGGVGNVYDAGYTEDKGKPNGEKGEYTPTDETAYDDVQNQSHKTPRHIKIRSLSDVRANANLLGQVKFETISL